MYTVLEFVTSSAAVPSAYCAKKPPVKPALKSSTVRPAASVARVTHDLQTAPGYLGLWGYLTYIRDSRDFP